LRLCLVCFWIVSLIFTGSYVLLHPDGVAHTTISDNQLFWLGVIKLNPIIRLPEFLLGMGAGVTFLRFRDRAQNWPIVLGALLVLLGILFQRYIPFPMMHSGLLAPAFALLIFGFATQPVWTRLLAAKPLVLLGEASYSLYLLHSFFIVMALVLFGLSPHLTLITVVTVLVAIFFSVIVYFVLEKPLRRLLHPRYATLLATKSISASVIS
jgi:peptidoglycan/LPS O-acetylase OafA/YrhL